MYPVIIFSILIENNFKNLLICPAEAAAINVTANMNFMMTDYAFLVFTILKLYIQKFTSVKESEQRKKSIQKKVIGYKLQ